MSKKEIIIGCAVAAAATGILYYLVSKPEKPKDPEEEKPEEQKVEEAPP